MTEPRRWRDGGDAPEGVNELLAHARRSRPMTKAERERVALRVDRIAALPAAVGLTLWLKGIAIAGGLVTTAVLVARGPDLWSGAPAPSVAPSAAVPGDRHDSEYGQSSTANAVAAPGPTGTLASPSPPDSAPSAAGQGNGTGTSPKAAAAPAASTSSEPDAETTLAREAALLEEARTLLGSRPSEALARLEQHAATFPRGKLGLERELLIVDALRRLGRTAEARARGEALLARSRGGLYADRIRSLLDSMP